MNNLYKYLFKNVKIICVDESIYSGFVELYEDEDDSEFGEQFIGVLIPNKNSKSGKGFISSEIKSIEVVD